ncbi:aminoglycoside phosphotransferase family protein [Nocardia sp. NPDC058058]|uniref:aminoglycoside phosphotransferase family protein n=1 Tax=Nocardia sp. NPDC058058 TaxID=3346317 RepID=UPI0036D9A0F5
MMVPPIPERLEKAIIFLRGEHDGRAWLDALPERITHYAQLWNLTLESIADSGAMSCCVYSTTLDGVPAVLKIPVDTDSGHVEVQLLQRWAAAHAAPEILQCANDSGVFLMTRIIPGTIAWPIDGTDDAHRFGRLLTRLNQPGLTQPPALKDVADIMTMRMDWARERFADPQYSDAMDHFRASERLEHAQRVLDRLLETTATQHVLHADLQAKNILHGPDRWYTIDPLGAFGDINAEAGLWIAVQDSPGTTLDRLHQLYEHPLLDPIRLHAWTFMLSILEYRPYLPASATRMEAFVRASNVDTVLAAIR